MTWIFNDCEPSAHLYLGLTSLCGRKLCVQNRLREKNKQNKLSLTSFSSPRCRICKKTSVSEKTSRKIRQREETLKAEQKKLYERIGCTLEHLMQNHLDDTVKTMQEIRDLFGRKSPKIDAEGIPARLLVLRDIWIQNNIIYPRKRHTHTA